MEWNIIGLIRRQNKLVLQLLNEVRLMSKWNKFMSDIKISLKITQPQSEKSNGTVECRMCTNILNEDCEWKKKKECSFPSFVRGWDFVLFGCSTTIDNYDIDFLSYHFSRFFRSHFLCFILENRFHCYSLHQYETLEIFKFNSRMSLLPFWVQLSIIVELGMIQIASLIA